MTASLVEAYKIPVKEGSIIADVQKGSPADKYGLMRGDVIVSIGGQKVKNSQDVVFSVRNKLAGDKVKFEVYRDGAKKSIDVTLGDIDGVKSPRLLGRKLGTPEAEQKTATQMGITEAQNSASLREKFGIKEQNGLIVAKIQQGSQGQRLGLRVGDVVLEVNRKKMESVNDWNSAMGTKNKALGLLVSRDGQTLFISVGM